MALIAMVSAKGSPGVTTSALAFALSWSGHTLLAECDPAGGDILAGYLGGLNIPPMGLLPLAVAQLRDQGAAELSHQLIDLDRGAPGHRLLLPGIADPAQAGILRPAWERLATLFTDLEAGQPTRDVIADCGRLTTLAAPWPVLHRSDLVLLVVRTATLRTVAPAVPAAARLRAELTGHGRGSGSLAALLVGPGARHRELSGLLGLPVAAELPVDRRSAAVLIDGGRLRGAPPLLRAAATAEAPLHRAIAACRAHLAAAPTSPPAGTPAETTFHTGVSARRPPAWGLTNRGRPDTSLPARFRNGRR